MRKIVVSFAEWLSAEAQVLLEYFEIGILAMEPRVIIDRVSAEPLRRVYVGTSEAILYFLSMLRTGSLSADLPGWQTVLAEMFRDYLDANPARTNRAFEDLRKAMTVEENAFFLPQLPEA